MAETPLLPAGRFWVVCREEEWVAAEHEGRQPEGVPWPAEDVRSQAAASTAA